MKNNSTITSADHSGLTNAKARQALKHLSEHEVGTTRLFTSVSGLDGPSEILQTTYALTVFMQCAFRDSQTIIAHLDIEKHESALDTLNANVMAQSMEAIGYLTALSHYIVSNNYAGSEVSS